MTRPTVFTSNNKKAIIASGTEVPVPVNTLTNANAGVINQTAAVSASIEYKKVATQLEVVPLINSEKEVSLDILQKIDNIVRGRQRQYQWQFGPDHRNKICPHECFRAERIDHHSGRVG